LAEEFFRILPAARLGWPKTRPPPIGDQERLSARRRTPLWRDFQRLLIENGDQKQSVIAEK
jgi:hypothetical protein